MSYEKLISSFILRVSEKQGREIITLYNLKTGLAQAFDNREAAWCYFERVSRTKQAND
jgi:hypothetical protein